MSSLPLHRYALDPTGQDTNNTVNGEVRTLPVSQVRAIAPMYAPFYTESLAIYDNGTNRLLVRGVDYKIVDLLQEATLRYGKEIAQLILVVNPTVGSEIRINYQVLGGFYQGNIHGIEELYNTFLADNRPVDWAQVLNTPPAYPPTLHRHLLEDVYGFESLVVALERIRNAIIVSDVPAYEALIEWVHSRGLSYADWQSKINMDKFVTGHTLDLILRNLVISNPGDGGGEPPPPPPPPPEPPKRMNTMHELKNACCLFDRGIVRNAKALYAVNNF
jgi:hypothetical protein